MATKVIHGHSCDDCWVDHLHEVDAEEHHVISIDGGPHKRFDFCSPSERAVMGRILRLYYECGDDLEQTQQASRSTELPASQEERQTAEEASPTPVARKRRTGKSAKALSAKGKESGGVPAPMQEPLPSDQAAAKPRQYIWCPEPHKSKGGKGMRVAYGDRNSHADMCHEGARMWDIPWEDPDGIIEVYCTSHAECMKSGIGFTGATGLRGHVRTSPLSHIDQPTDEGPSEQPDGS